MLFLLGGDKKARKPEPKRSEVNERVKQLFVAGRFPVVTTDFMEGKNICKVLGLVCCRGYDSEEAFFGMATMAVNKGAHAIVGYIENIAFHPDGSKFFSCYGTAVMFEWEQDEKFGAAALRESPLQMSPRSSESHMDRMPHAPRAGASTERDERNLPPRMESSFAEPERPSRVTQRSGDSNERPSRLSARIDDDLDMDLPPLRPAGSTPSWSRT